ncbi:TMV resistance protein N-like [Gastrolobium bilobum]|uniref:TMV resistance protein N-like n=1 Tax=Gastrolobium bilobum TaxID=150636 RepID=UPI002AB168F9|nr:TMV resistance protein N-like [Gastrolobium bilobum]XP_061343745.1 TMV resistance protein N-like [Gastrolobium bilobum]
MASQEPSLPSSSFSYRWKYDVFLSFRGEDTRHGFTGHLYKTLHDRGIHTFIDDEELQRGEGITPALLKAIEESRIAIIVLSKNYASSSFCLDELVHILHCIKEKGRLVLPVFYDVDPSHVRHQRDSYEEALSTHEKRFKDDMEKVQKWRVALRQAADLSGFHFKQQGNENEYEFIGKIAKVVSNKINRVPLHVADYPVGLESKVLQVISLLNVGSDGVHMIGIHGIGGIGKTTVARAIYNLIAESFEALCFLDNVRENSIKYGLEHIQETLISKVFGEKDIKLASVNEGISIIEHRLHQKKVLLVLDDVDRLEQLRATVGGLDWFGCGSKIIITTRDRHLLTRHGVEKTYEVDGLNNKEALELLCWNAFKTDKVDSSYVDILKRAITFSSGLPLALEVIGSYLFGKGIQEWESALDQYERIPNKEIQKILEISFHSLGEYEQEIFIHIACYFKGNHLAYVKKLLYAHHGFCPEYGIGVLIEKSLIKIVYGQVTLHDLIEDMGKEIVRQEAPKEPGQRSRLWFPDDIVQVLEDNTGTSSIQIIILDFLKFEEVVEWDGNGFKQMRNLKTLIIRNARFSEGPKHLPSSLRVLEWWEYPSPSLPSNFNPKKLVILELPQSRLVSIDLLMSNKVFVNMKVLNFNHCQYITEIPDVSGVPNLEELSFGDCENLIKIHESVGFLNELKILNAEGCKKFRSFPPIKLTSLEKLKLSYCPSLENFPEILGKMEKIKLIHVFDTRIKELPFSIQNLTQLERIDLKPCGGMFHLPRSILMLREFDELNVWNCEGLLISKQEEGDDAQVSSLEFEISFWECNLSDEFIRKGLPLFVNELTLTDSNFTILPVCMRECLFLTEIMLYRCKNFCEIGGIPPNLKKFTARECKSLKDLDLTLFPECLTTLELYNCENLQEIRGISPNIRTLDTSECPSLTSECRNMLLNEELHKEGGDKVFLLPETKIPEWFENCFNGPSISFRFRNMDFPAISICFAIRLNNVKSGTGSEYWPRFKLNIEVNGISKVTGDDFSLGCKAGDYTVLFDIKQEIFLLDDVVLLEENTWNCVVCTISNRTDPVFVKQSGIHVFEEGRSMADIQFTDPLLLEEEHRLVDMEDSQKHFVQHQNNLAPLPFLETINLGKGRGLLSLLPPPALNDNVIWHSNLMLSRLRSSTPNFQGCEIVSRERKIGMLNLDLNNGASEPCSPAPSKVVFNSAVSSFASGAAGEEGESSSQD